MTEQTDGLNVTEAAAFLGVSRTTVYTLLKAGAIPHWRLGDAPRFSRTVLTIWQGGAQMTALMAAVARLAAAAEVPPAAVSRAPTGAPTAPRQRLTPKHIGARRPPRTAPLGRIPRSGATADDRG